MNIFWTIVGHFAYFIFLMWLAFVTFMNFVLKPYLAMSKNGKFTVETLWVYYCVFLWAVALTIPVAYNLIGG